MRQETRPVFIAFDETPFSTAAECREYESQNLPKRLAGLTEEQVEKALKRWDVDLADAIEEAGVRIQRARREAGDLKRKRGNGEAEPAATAGEQQSEAA